MTAFKVAILDMNNGFPNQGMRCIKEILESYADVNSVHLDYEVFDVRQFEELPGLEFDAYISTGGPGSPFDGEGTSWEERYFDLINQIYVQNTIPGIPKKHVLFICHSFQMICRYFEVGKVTKRKSNSFGVFPAHKTSKGMHEPLFLGLDDPFFIVDSRDWQVVQPNHRKIDAMGAKILALEKIRPHVPLERCIMAMRLTDEFFGTQFHPEADARGMTAYLMDEEKKNSIKENHGEQKYNWMLSQLNDPDKIMLTQQIIIPGFLDQALSSALIFQQ